MLYKKKKSFLHNLYAIFSFIGCKDTVLTHIASASFAQSKGKGEVTFNFCVLGYGLFKIFKIKKKMGKFSSF